MRSHKPSNFPAPRFDPEQWPRESAERAVEPEPIAFARTPPVHRVCDGFTEGLLYFMVIFTPWAFGTTQTWSIWTMNAAAFSLGLLLLAKWFIRWGTGFRPSRWDDPPVLSLRGAGTDPGWEPSDDWTEPLASPPARASRRMQIARILTIALAILTALILGYCLVAALNARATYHHAQMRLEYHEPIRWLPHSYDSKSTWFSFWQYLGLACLFWALRDWVLGKTRQERFDAVLETQDRTGSRSGQARGTAEPVHALRHRPSALLPARLQCLLWVLCLNATLLGVVSILQRLDGTNKLLWLVEPRWNKTADAQFGPYAYRSNAAQYFNLLWPVCLGFWWTLRRAGARKPLTYRRIGAGPHVVLLPCAVLLAASPIISITRGGALIAAGNMVLALAVLVAANRKGKQLVQLGFLVLFLASLGLAGFLAWEKLELRFRGVFTEMVGRTEIYENCAQIARDYPLFGTGPGTFASIYQYYRQDPNQRWQAYVHNDWLETRITFGWIGYILILAALAVPFIHWLSGGRGIRTHWVFPAMIWLGLSSCLLHAKFDFPFQVYSVAFLFVTLSSISFSVRRAGRA